MGSRTFRLVPSARVPARLPCYVAGNIGEDQHMKHTETKFGSEEAFGLTCEAQQMLAEICRDWRPFSSLVDRRGALDRTVNRYVCSHMNETLPRSARMEYDAYARSLARLFRRRVGYDLARGLMSLFHCPRTRQLDTVTLQSIACECYHDLSGGSIVGRSSHANW
jgi:hypothetical protein